MRTTAEIYDALQATKARARTDAFADMESAGRQVNGLRAALKGTTGRQRDELEALLFWEVQNLEIAENAVRALPKLGL